MKNTDDKDPIKKAARLMGKKGGSKTSERKTISSRLNARRPRRKRSKKHHENNPTIQ